MKISEREQQILRIRSTSFQPELSTALESKLRQAVVEVTQATIEAALVEELLAERARQGESFGRRSGYFSRVLDTEQGRIETLRVPKLRSGNKARSWQILERYQRGIGSLVNFTLSLYVMGRATAYWRSASVTVIKCHKLESIATQGFQDSAFALLFCREFIF